MWEGDWRTDIFMASLKEMDKGNSVKLVLTVDGQVKETRTSSLPVLGHKPLQLCQFGTRLLLLSTYFSSLYYFKAEACHTDLLIHVCTEPQLS